MSYQLKEVAARIRALREISGASQEEMANITGTTPDEYAKLEGGETDFGFSFIYKCADYFGVEMKDLLEGNSPSLSLYTVTKKGEGLPIVKDTGFVYNNLSPRFKGKAVEPFFVTLPYSPDSQPVFSSHEGQEIDVVIKGQVAFYINGKTELLSEGDTVYYNSSYPHALAAVGGNAEIYAFVVKTTADGKPVEQMEIEPAVSVSDDYIKGNSVATGTVADNFIESSYDENGVFNGITFKNDDKFNFAFDCVDAIAEKNPDKLAMMWVANDKSDRRFTFSDMKKIFGKNRQLF